MKRYTGFSITMHWLHAMLVVSLLALGWSMVDLPKGPERSWAIGLHKSLGLSALLLVALRLAWRVRHAPPPSPLPDGERRLSQAAHRMLYALLLLAPLAGYLSTSFTAYPMKFFGLALPKAGWPDAALNGLFNGLHKASVWALALLVALHVAAALRHAWRRDGVVLRMLPGFRRSVVVTEMDRCSILEQPENNPFTARSPRSSGTPGSG